MPKISPQAAGYMELIGAIKDASCRIVDVPGGVASHKGCCNLYKPQKDADEFRCGECKYVEKASNMLDVPLHEAFGAS